MGTTAGSIGIDTGLSTGQFVSVGLGLVASSYLPRYGFWECAGQSTSGYSVERKQNGVRLHGHSSSDVQPVSLSAARAPGVLVAGAASDAVGVIRYILKRSSRMCRA